MTATSIPVTIVSTGPGTRDETDYHSFLEAMQKRFDSFTEDDRQLFTVAVGGDVLWRTYLANIGKTDRQHHTCHACKRFFEQYGNVVLLEESGAAVSPFWNVINAPVDVQVAVGAVKHLVETSRVNGVFLSSEKKWGIPVTGEWRHMAVVPDKSLVFKKQFMTDSQRMAELKEDFRCLQTALNDFSPEVLQQAKTILEADALSRSEKFVGQVNWLIERQKERKGNTPYRTNLLWKAVASAPVGFCKPRSGMIGGVGEDVEVLGRSDPHEDDQHRSI